MDGMFVSEERVERDGVLVAFEGERMSMDEAVRRGLVGNEPEPEPEQEPEPETETAEKPAPKKTSAGSKKAADEG